MARFEAVFDCGDDDRVSEWKVVEWTYDDGHGNQFGSTIARAQTKLDAEQQAAILNTALEVELNGMQECEFDC
jgi:hypothetical protein